ncbi:MAG: RNA 2',3'-cyclic phosphodiesterase [Maricaulaceae bacterium]|jgi:2'-5' RNA ligase
MSLRLFAAIDIPDEIIERIVPLQRGVAGAKWRPPEALHLTLRFFGEIDERAAEDLDHELGEVRSAAFEVALKGAGWFGGEQPSALWAGVEENAALQRLAAGCERAARKTGLPPEPRGFVPHVTLAYCRGTGADDAVKFAQRLALFSAEPFLVDRFFMYSSWAGKRVSTYVPEAEYPLLG